MPLYFAYGANMDVQAMARRCPRSHPVGLAALRGFAFFISDDGFASVRRSAGAVVHGLAWTLSFQDIPALDRYEEVAAGLYRKLSLPMRFGRRSSSALVYVGRSFVPGSPVEGYMDAVVRAAATANLPPAYLGELRSWAADARHRPTAAPLSGWHGQDRRVL